MSDPLDKKARNAAVEELRQTHFAKLEKIFLKMYDVALNAERDQDKVNAAKWLGGILGVARPAADRPAVTPPAAPEAER